jgi:hypothetical protein
MALRSQAPFKRSSLQLEEAGAEYQFSTVVAFRDALLRRKAARWRIPAMDQRAILRVAHV